MNATHTTLPSLTLCAARLVGVLGGEIRVLGGEITVRILRAG